MPTLRVRLAASAVAVSALCGTASAQPISPGRPRDASPPAARTGTIRGRVVDAATGRGIPRVELSLGGFASGRMSDEDGAFAFEEVPSGRHTIHLIKPTYVPTQWPDRQRGRKYELIEVVAGGVVEGLRIPLRRESAITGRVVDQFGDPVPNARVSIRTFPAPNRHPRRPPGRRDARTNDIGEFRLSPVQPGRYRLSASVASDTFPWPGFPTVERSGFVAWPQSPSLDHAEPLVVEAGEQVSDIELQLFPTKSAKVTGIVLDVDGTPALSASLYVAMAGPGDVAADSGRSVEMRDGRFELTLAPAGYELSAKGFERPKPGGMPNTGRQMSSETVKLIVTGEPIGGIVLQLKAPQLVSGCIAFDGAGAAPPPSAIRLYAASGRGECSFNEGDVHPDLTFTMKVYGRRCQVAAGAVAPWTMRSVTAGGKDVTFEGIPVRASEPVGDVVITFTDRSTKLRMTAGSPKGGRAEEFVVFVFPLDRDKRSTPLWGHPGLTEGTTRELGPDMLTNTGELIVDGLLPGEYLAVAIHPDDYDACGAPETWDLLEPHGRRVTLAEGDIRVLSVTIVDLPDSP
jgi:hypothetical protein